MLRSMDGSVMADSMNSVALPNLLFGDYKASALGSCFHVASTPSSAGSGHASVSFLRINGYKAALHLDSAIAGWVSGLGLDRGR